MFVPPTHEHVMTRLILFCMALMLAGCGESEPTQPAKRASLDDIKSAVERMVQGRPKAKSEPIPEPPPIAARPVELPAPARAVKPKPKKEWQRKKATAKRATSGGVAGYSCTDIRKAGSPAIVEAMAAARGYAVSDSDSRKIKACFNKDK